MASKIYRTLQTQLEPELLNYVNRIAKVERIPAGAMLRKIVQEHKEMAEAGYKHSEEISNQVLKIPARDKTNIDLSQEGRADRRSVYNILYTWVQKNTKPTTYGYLKEFYDGAYNDERLQKILTELIKLRLVYQNGRHEFIPVNRKTIERRQTNEGSTSST